MQLVEDGARRGGGGEKVEAWLARCAFEIDHLTTPQPHTHTPLTVPWPYHALWTAGCGCTRQWKVYLLPGHAGVSGSAGTVRPGDAALHEPSPESPRTALRPPPPFNSAQPHPASHCIYRYTFIFFWLGDGVWQAGVVRTVGRGLLVVCFPARFSPESPPSAVRWAPLSCDEAAHVTCAYIYVCMLSRSTIVVNLDPANEDALYECAVDVRDLVNVTDVMTTLELGPNAGASPLTFASRSACMLTMGDEEFYASVRSTQSHAWPGSPSVPSSANPHPTPLHPASPSFATMNSPCVLHGVPGGEPRVAPGGLGAVSWFVDDGTSACVASG